MVDSLIISGCGINCEREIAQGLKLAGARFTIVHAHDFLKQKVMLSNYQMLIFPGGFSFGDELGAAKAFANRICSASQMKDRLLEFVEKKKLILGICNGFQLLLKLGLLPDGGAQLASLAMNESGRFENRWVHHKTFQSPCIFTRGIEMIYLPVRHFEGNFVLKDEKSYQALLNNHQVVFRYVTPEGIPTKTYPANPNGSQDAIAGICDPTGRIFGMMAHPEAFLTIYHHPRWTRLKIEAERAGKILPTQGEGLKLFKNAVDYIKNHL